MLLATPLERTASSSSPTTAEKCSLRKVEEEVRMWLELGEWLDEIGWVLSVAGMVSIETPLTHSRQNLERKDRPFKSLNYELNFYGLHSRN